MVAAIQTTALSCIEQYHSQIHCGTISAGTNQGQSLTLLDQWRVVLGVATIDRFHYSTFLFFLYIFFHFIFFFVFSFYNSKINVVAQYAIKSKFNINSKGLSTREGRRGHAIPHMPVEMEKCWWLLKIEPNAWAGGKGSCALCTDLQAVGVHLKAGNVR